ncbi:MAG: universal stress protein [Actinomycetota bacterium]|nr:universal stress protein [Actinomycetota bacterium]
MARRAGGVNTRGDMLRHICVAYDDDERAGWGLEVARDLARRASARLTIAHVVPPVDEAVDIREELLIELAGLREDVRWRHRLKALAATVRDVETHVHVLPGRVSFQLLELLHQERPDLVVAGTRALRGVQRSLAPRLRHALLAQAPCPVMLVRTPPAPDRQPVVLFCGRTATANRSVAAARAFAASLRWQLVRCRAPAHGRDAATLNAVLAACREHRPGFAVIAGERCHGLRSRLGTSGTAALIDAAPCPVLVLSPAGRQAPIVRASRRRAPSAV